MAMKHRWSLEVAISGSVGRCARGAMAMKEVLKVGEGLCPMVRESGETSANGLQGGRRARRDKEMRSSGCIHVCESRLSA